MHYARHVRDVHRQWRPYLCDLCGKAFKRPDALKQHKYLLNVYQISQRNISNFKFIYKKSPSLETGKRWLIPISMSH
jgi:hypothetical protein